jgi:hypothetical protein
VRHTPEKQLRGIHFHTQHPIEAYFAYWADGPLDDVKHIHSWTVENRGNYVEWMGLGDIVDSPARAADWRARTAQIIDDAHARGLRTGLGVELFARSDFQHGFNLVDGDPATLGDPTAAVDDRLGLLAGLGFDVIDLSFGEFTAIDPATFIRVLDVAAAEIRARLGAQVAATVHVGGLPSQQVTWMGRTIPYYFLVQFADPSIVPWIHTVMYYDLYEDTGGAYDLQSFDQQRQYLYSRLGSKQPVAYYPETAYWVAFDDSVPLYLPLYVRSRFLDLSRIRADAAAGGYPDLDAQVQFSSGFEWGYWQQDRITLRMGFELPSSWQAPIADLFPPALAGDVTALADVEHDSLIGLRLAAYLAGRDAYVETGATAGIHSQPTRPSFADVVAMTPDARDAWVTSVLMPLGDLSSKIAALAAATASDADTTDPDQAEAVDGAAIDAARARFIHALYAAALAKATGGDTATPRAEAEETLSAAQAIVARRHAGIPANVRSDCVGNATIYPFGYLAQADVLCYWQRELVQLANLVDPKSTLVPGCIF